MEPIASATPEDKPAEYILTLSCPDVPGIVHAVAAFLIEHDMNIRESQQSSDPEDGTFFMRVQFTSIQHRPPHDFPGIRQDFESVADAFGMTWRLTTTADKPRAVIMVSKMGHCLNDLLFRAATGRLAIDIRAIVANHPDLGYLADNYDIPFHHIPVTADSKPAAEARLIDLITDQQIDLVILARYMQILSADLCKFLEGRAINIHHSMLPSFKGARPYHQAHRRGVKLIGATAHYVTSDLDEGPIIEQEVARVDHSHTTADVVALGQDNECSALARAVRWHAENRVLLHGHSTVVFR
ncbi:formyltetrahydrofolate deformylase [Nocardia sp. CA-120079]|uniref:formyltetrahydrofolate deformylase n=1 Tax=Nocardia sp. CA-120079 TaxID=3239974 RepID=UPI003D994474